ncbi:hypothetical protein DFH09DRAFT_1081822 [Mycena vulgaris]|nr:hypothetical protein DFH09DRAFT_1081822 [Mycena vulgaris]
MRGTDAGTARSAARRHGVGGMEATELEGVLSTRAADERIEAARDNVRQRAGDAGYRGSSQQRNGIGASRWRAVLRLPHAAWRREGRDNSPGGRHGGCKYLPSFEPSCRRGAGAGGAGEERGAERGEGVDEREDHGEGADRGEGGEEEGWSPRTEREGGLNGMGSARREKGEDSMGQRRTGGRERARRGGGGRMGWGAERVQHQASSRREEGGSAHGGRGEEGREGVGKGEKHREDVDAGEERGGRRRRGGQGACQDLGMPMRRVERRERVGAREREEVDEAEPGMVKSKNSWGGREKNCWQMRTSRRRREDEGRTARHRPTRPPNEHDAPDCDDVLEARAVAHRLRVLVRREDGERLERERDAEGGGRALDPGVEVRARNATVYVTEEDEEEAGARGRGVSVRGAWMEAKKKSARETWLALCVKIAVRSYLAAAGGSQTKVEKRTREDSHTTELIDAAIGGRRRAIHIRRRSPERATSATDLGWGRLVLLGHAENARSISRMKKREWEGHIRSERRQQEDTRRRLSMIDGIIFLPRILFLPSLPDDVRNAKAGLVSLDVILAELEIKVGRPRSSEERV